MAVLRLEKVDRRVGGRWVLWDVNLEVAEGEILGIFGRSDSGKTALARVIVGLDKPTNGTVELAESIVPSIAFGTPVTAPELSVYENLRMFAGLWGIDSNRQTKEIVRLVELMKLTDHRTSRPGSLSLGALRRLEIARALLADSPITVIDSLLDTLDSDLLEKLWEHLLDQRRNRARSFVITTVSGRIAEMCGRIAVISRGKLGFMGRPEDFRRLAGEDVVVLGEMVSPFVKSKIEDRFSVMIREEDGFLSFRVSKGEKMVSDLLAEFGSELGCVYLKRPRLEDALDALTTGRTAA